VSSERPQPLPATNGEDPERLAASEELGRSFKALLAAVRRLRGRESRQQGGLSNAQYGLLFGLCEHDELSSSELASAADLSPATATEMLEGLAAAGLVTRKRSERDRRVVLISLTARGRTLVEERREDLQPRWRAALAEFSDAELRIAGRVLERLQDMFDQLPEDV
jgi:MarR family transcriptional regulator, organic hydroperoxide resistance regulator